MDTCTIVSLVSGVACAIALKCYSPVHPFDSLVHWFNPTNQVHADWFEKLSQKYRELNDLYHENPMYVRLKGRVDIPLIYSELSMKYIVSGAM